MKGKTTMKEMIRKRYLSTKGKLAVLFRYVKAMRDLKQDSH